MSRTRYPNADCPVCRRPIGPDDVVESCAQCETSYHERCWKRAGGCGTAGCPNGSKKAKPKRAAQPPTATAATEPAVAATAEAAPTFPERPRASATPWYAAASAVLLVAVVLTVAVSLIATQRRAAKEELQNAIDSARESGGAAQVVTAMEQFLKRQPSGRVARAAQATLEAARKEVDDDDYRRAQSAAAGASGNLDRLEAALKEYLAAHPDGSHRQEAEQRLSRIPQERDAAAYRQAEDRARAAGDDVTKLQAAWEGYLRDYPQGMRAADVRARLAQLPEREDEQRFEQLKGEVDSLVAEDRLTDALLRIDRGQSTLHTAARREEMAAVGRRLETKLERVDAARCLEPPSDTPAEREARMAQCRLYLVCYPEGPARNSVASQLANIIKVHRAETIKQIQSELVRLSDNPENGLRFAAESLRNNAIPVGEMRAEVIALHAARFRQRMDQSFAELRLIKLKDGTVLVGTIRNENSTPIQVDLRNAGGDGARTTRLLAQSQIESIGAPPPKVEWDKLSANWPKGDVQGLTDVNFVSAVRSLRILLDNDEYRPEWELCQVFLAAVAPSDKEACDAAAAGGFFTIDGVLLPGSGPRGAAPSDWRRRLERLAATLETEATASAEVWVGLQENAYQLPLFTTTLDVPVDWNLGRVTTDVQPGSGGMSGSIVFRYSLSLERRADVALTPSFIQQVDDGLEQINRDIRFEIEYEIRSAPSRTRGIGVLLERQGEQVVVKYVSPGSPAEAAGLLVGDRLCMVGDAWVEPGQDPAAVAARFATSGDRIAIVALRGDRRFRVDVALREIEMVTYQSRERLVAVVKSLKNPVTGRDWSDWTDIEVPQ